jgi:hypothetical protein
MGFGRGSARAWRGEGLGGVRIVWAVGKWVEGVQVGPHHWDMITTTFGVLLVGASALVAGVLQQQAGRGWGSIFGPL